MKIVMFADLTSSLINAPDDPVKATIVYNRKLFEILNEFFIRATGRNTDSFSTIDGFSKTCNLNAEKISSRCRDAYIWFYDEMNSFYGSYGTKAFGWAKEMKGMTLNIGGSSRFLGSHLASVTTSLLYSDTVLIPDPILPWLEDSRKEEKFRDVSLLETAHVLLHLKPLIDADLPYPAIAVYPSWEKTLEKKDQETQDGINSLIRDVLSYHLKVSFSDISEVVKYIRKNPDKFYEAVEKGHLFVAPNGPCNEHLEDALERYEKEISIWRAPEEVNKIKELPKYSKLFVGISERLIPMYHLIENSMEHNAHPLMALEQHAHYFKIVTQTGYARLENIGKMRPETSALVNALASKRIKLLSDITPEMLTHIRANNENVAFRNKLFPALSRLSESSLQDIDSVTEEICHEIDSAIFDYEQEIANLQKKHQKIHLQTLVCGAATFGGLFIPCVAPFLGSAAPLALLGKFAFDKYNEIKEEKKHTRSLMGILASKQRSR